MWQYVISLLFLSTFLFFNEVEAKEYAVEEYDENDNEDYADYYYDDEDQYEDDEDQYEDEEEEAATTRQGVTKPQVAFRLDDLQKLWTDASVALDSIITMFTVEFRMKLTGGIICSHWYDEPSGDPLMQGAVEAALVTGFFDVANHGMTNDVLVGLPLAEQQSQITECNNIIYNSLGVTPTVFFPAENAFDPNTIQALSNLQFKCFSSQRSLDTPNFVGPLKHIPVNAATSWDGAAGSGVQAAQVMSLMEAAIKADGYAALMMHPLDYEPDLTLAVLRSILTQVAAKDWDVVFLKDIQPLL